MREHIFEPCISFDNKIKSVKDLILDHDFKYSYLTNGVNIVGNITLTFTIEDEFTSFPFSINHPVELFISLNEIDSLKEITLEIEDFSYEINEKELKFKIFTKLKGNKEDFVFFELSPNQNINQEAISLLMRNITRDNNKINMSNSSLKRFEELIKTSALDLISSSSEEIICNDDIIEFSTLEENNYDNVNEVEVISDIEMVEDHTIEKTEIQKEVGNEEVKEEPIAVESLVNEQEAKNEINEEKNDEINEEKDDLNKDINPVVIKKEEEKELILKRNDDNQKTKKEELFKEKYVSGYFFYVLKENEVKRDILDKFKIDEIAFDNLNKNIDYKKGTLVRIPK